MGRSRDSVSCFVAGGLEGGRSKEEDEKEARAVDRDV